jgi:hypothetical protein
MATVFKRRWLRTIPAGAEIIKRGGEPFAVWADGKNKRKRRAPLSPDGERVILYADTYTVEWWDESNKRRKRGTKFVDKDSAQELADKLERQAEKRRSGLMTPHKSGLPSRGISQLPSTWTTLWRRCKPDRIHPNTWTWPVATSRK